MKLRSMRSFVQRSFSKRHFAAGCLALFGAANADLVYAQAPQSAPGRVSIISPASTTPGVASIESLDEPEVQPAPQGEYEPQYVQPYYPPAAPSRPIPPGQPMIAYNAMVPSTIRSCDQPAIRVWGGLEYLLWWVKDAPNPTPLLTTNPVDGGVLGQPGTTVLFGQKEIGYDLFSGGRFTIGGWFFEDEALGAEVSAFMLEKREETFDAASNLPNFPIGVPFLSDFNTQSVFPNALVLPLDGNFHAVSTLKLWGAEANLLYHMAQRNTWHVDAYLGFRYLDLRESLTMVTDFDGGFFQLRSFDSFGTSNQFYGGQVGAKLAWQRGIWTADVIGKVALGVTHQETSINGSSEQTIFGIPLGQVQEGIFARSTNIGRQSENQIGVVPQVSLKVGANVLPSLRLTLGYDFLYWNTVVRPGDQITTPGDPTLPATQRPQRVYNTTDFFAHGASVGFEFRY